MIDSGYRSADSARELCNNSPINQEFRERRTVRKGRTRKEAARAFSLREPAVLRELFSDFHTLTRRGLFSAAADLEDKLNRHLPDARRVGAGHEAEI